MLLFMFIINLSLSIFLTSLLMQEDQQLKKIINFRNTYQENINPDSYDFFLFKF
jgi:hypothetical protein